MNKIKIVKHVYFIKYLIAAMLVSIVMPAVACSSGSSDEDFTISNITLAPSVPLPLVVGSTQQFTAIATFSDGFTTYDVTTVANWSSTNVTVATINNSGLATAVGPGTCQIRAGLTGVPTASATLTVNPGVVLSSVIITPAEPGKLNAGSTLQFTATASYSDGSTVDITSRASWKSSDVTVATIDNVTMGTTYRSGLARGVSPGTCDITATFSGITSAPATLTVVPG